MCFLLFYEVILILYVLAEKCIFNVFKWCFCKELNAQSAHVSNKSSQVSALSVCHFSHLPKPCCFSFQSMDLETNQMKGGLIGCVSVGFVIQLMQRWKVPVSFGSLQQNRCLGTNQNPVCRKNRHGIAGRNRDGALSETWPHISNFTLAGQSQLIMSISSCWLVELLSRTVMLVSCSTSPGQKYLSTSWRTFLARMGLCTGPAPQNLISSHCSPSCMSRWCWCHAWKHSLLFKSCWATSI